MLRAFMVMQLKLLSKASPSYKKKHNSTHSENKLVLDQVSNKSGNLSDVFEYEWEQQE
jgi:hypothetical protein